MQKVQVYKPMTQPNKMRKSATKIRSLLTAVIFGVGLRTAAADVSEITKAQYDSRSSKDGIVLLAVNWGRLWRVRGFENAELRGIYFDLAGSVKGDTDSPDLAVNGPSGVFSRLATKPAFINYAIMLPAGRYLMSGFDVKVAQSVSAIYHIKPDRASVVVNGQSKLGYFDVKPGEIVYIGNFFLDGAQEPFIWRYYSPMPKAFTAHMAEFRAKYRFLPIDDVKYRLFETSTIGMRYPAPVVPDQLPDPKPPSVTPLAGAGGAPSAGSDH